HAFMDMNTYDQIEIPESLIENELKFIKENSSVDIVMFEGEVIGLDLPKNVELEVSETEPGITGDTVSGGTKYATLETGLVIEVEKLMNEGDVLIGSREEVKYQSRDHTG